MNRDAKGRFKKNNTIGKTGGRPKKVTERRYLQVLINAVDETSWEIVCKQALHDAMQGDDYARRWISNRLLGVPAKTLNLNIGDMAVLTQLIKAIEHKGLSASTLFTAMLNEIIVDAEYEDIDIESEEQNVHLR